jgi:hypothetical protein
MYRNRLFVLLILLFKLTGDLYAQQKDTVKINIIYDTIHSYRQPLKLYTPKDTIKLFLDDTAYYIQKDYRQIDNEYRDRIGYAKYFFNTHCSGFELKDNLPDGYYCLYSITKKQAYKMENYKKYFVASGEFKNGMKQGEFVLYLRPEYPTKKEPFNNWIESYKKISFKNDTVHGKVIEIIGGRFEHFGEYNMGVKDGFFCEIGYKIILYKDGEIVKETEMR